MRLAALQVQISCLYLVGRRAVFIWGWRYGKTAELVDF